MTSETIDQKFNIITVGFNLAGETTKAAKANPDVWFVGVDQSPICVDAQGALDTTFACKGDAKTLCRSTSRCSSPRQAGYLARIVASITKVNKIGAIGGINSVPPVVRYIGATSSGRRRSIRASCQDGLRLDGDFTKPSTTRKGRRSDPVHQGERRRRLFRSPVETGNGVSTRPAR
jgi:hypothetical protein